MPVVDLCTEQDVYTRIGGQNALAQIGDPQARGTRDAGILAAAIRDATNDTVGAAGVQTLLAGLTQPQIAERHPELVSITARRAVAYVWIYGSRGQAIPTHAAELKTASDAELQRLAERRRKHGAADFEPSISQNVNGGVNNDPNGTRMTLDSFRGFF